MLAALFPGGTAFFVVAADGGMRAGEKSGPERVCEARGTKDVCREAQR